MTPTQLENVCRVTPEEYATFGAALPASAQAQRDGAGSAGATGCGFPPPTKRGGKVPKRRDAQHLNEVKLVLTDSGETKMVMVRKPIDGECAFIDGMRFTVGVETWHRGEKGTLLTDSQVMTECSLMMERVFGFGVTKSLGHGRDFYTSCFVLGEDLGYVCMGGKSQRGTMLIVLHGTGAMAARAGWEGRLFQFLSTVASRPTITRIDLAHDDYEGAYWTCDYADRAFDLGWWKMGGRMPSHEYRGNWKRPDGSGRTLYIGKRKNGKLCRTYEKGKQLGDESSLWVRCEVEVHNNDRVIPLDVLLHPSGYFLGQYDALCVIAPHIEGKRIRTARAVVQITVQACLDNVKKSYGAYIRVLRLALGDVGLLDAIQRNDDVYPVRLKTPDETMYGKGIHLAPTVSADVESGLFGVFA
ncbi:phage replication protein [Aromatoleum toluvorans]|uniref:Phage replication protein n=1 Tax=Aromatoleum toluvorans TaxID=92002 RepID=A0ABX1Q479_9RHOO|nr:replication initiation factor domain-containing protein [Aromatoleum toluvorans]NMG45551.1 phage replication protein [Aromatoleum toluvorans]